MIKFHARHFSQCFLTATSFNGCNGCTKLTAEEPTSGLNCPRGGSSWMTELGLKPPETGSREAPTLARSSLSWPRGCLGPNLRYRSTRSLICVLGRALNSRHISFLTLHCSVKVYFAYHQLCMLLRSFSWGLLYDALSFLQLLSYFSNLQQSCKNPREYLYTHYLDSTSYIITCLLFHTPILLPTQPSIHPCDGLPTPKVFADPD